MWVVLLTVRGVNRNPGVNTNQWENRHLIVQIINNLQCMLGKAQLILANKSEQNNRVSFS